jgi:predicted flap endonuclease-1-like 5' DNA nuclease
MDMHFLLLHIPGLHVLLYLLLAMLLPLLLGILLGYWLWYHYKRLAAETALERDKYHRKFTELEADYASLKYKYDELGKDNKALRSSLNSVQADLTIMRSKYEKLQREGEGEEEKAEKSAPPVYDRGVAEAPPVKGKGIDYSALFKPDNLQIIEGIGPKIENALKGSGFRNWSDLAGADPAAISEALQKADPNYRMQDPATWPQQAKLANEGKWSDLIEFQKTLDAGRTEAGSLETPAKVAQVAAETLGFTGSQPDNLKIVEGIGPKVEQLLKDAGINTWADLAGATEEKLKEILEAGGDQYRLAKPDTWPEQARLAQAGQWKELREYQDFLQGGSEPGKK